MTAGNRLQPDAAVSARERLERLRAVLEHRGWHADHRGTDQRPFLHVRNPVNPGFHDSVAVLADRYIWKWGVEIGPTDDVPGVADRVMHVLRVVTP